MTEPCSVQIWLPGDLTDPEAQPSHYLTHVGGFAAFPGTCAPKQAASILCSVCHAPLALVLQASAAVTIGCCLAASA